VVDVTGSSWPLSGVPLSSQVLQVLARCAENEKRRVLDFGAGTWLRYPRYILEHHPELELFVVEYEEAFAGRSPQAAAACERTRDQATVWTPGEFDTKKVRKQRFDAVLLVNVLNTVPEPGFREDIVKTLSERLYPSGWLVVYQRIWTGSELKGQFFEYQDGWIVPLDGKDYCTYRARTGAKWFNQVTRELPLRVLDLDIGMSSGNTFFRVWQKRFG